MSPGYQTIYLSPHPDDAVIPFCRDVEAYLPQKLAAMRCYASQIQDLPNMPDEAVAYARSLSPDGKAVERTWCLE
jgi:LmbE family N-acetylglucosaminyl deacetylase